MSTEFLRINSPCKKCSQRGNMDNCPQLCEDYEDYLVAIGEKSEKDSIPSMEVVEEL